MQARLHLNLAAFLASHDPAVPLRVGHSEIWGASLVWFYTGPGSIEARLCFPGQDGPMQDRGTIKVIHNPRSENHNSSIILISPTLQVLRSIPQCWLLPLIYLGRPVSPELCQERHVLEEGTVHISQLLHW